MKNNGTFEGNEVLVALMKTELFRELNGVCQIYSTRLRIPTKETNISPTGTLNLYVKIEH